MEFKNELSFNVKWDYKTISFFILLLILPNLLGLINIPTIFGFKIHFFQLGIFIAALIFGPKGGALTGLTGSIYSAILMNNPFIIGGNIILGFFFGLFSRKNINPIFSVILAFLIQLPWLIITDYYFINLPIQFIQALIVTLAISNIIWTLVATYSVKPIRKILKI